MNAEFDLPVEHPSVFGAERFRSKWSGRSCPFRARVLSSIVLRRLVRRSVEHFAPAEGMPSKLALPQGGAAGLERVGVSCDIDAELCGSLRISVKVTAEDVGRHGIGLVGFGMRQ